MYADFQGQKAATRGKFFSPRQNLLLSFCNHGLFRNQRNIWQLRICQIQLLQVTHFKTRVVESVLKKLFLQVFSLSSYGLSLLLFAFLCRIAFQSRLITVQGRKQLLLISKSQSQIIPNIYLYFEVYKDHKSFECSNGVLIVLRDATL